ncbi:MAG: hypothetical protein QGG42_12220 [Phycisphaerae bacterium]|jgi:hypothetical protein|nr:hypothetical protein [Phycisphaerae bacterium]
MTKEKLLRIKQELGDMRWEDFAKALNVSTATMMRYKEDPSKMPEETHQLLECFLKFLEEDLTDETDRGRSELKGAVVQKGFIGVLAAAAVAGALPVGLLASVTVVPALAWIAGVFIGHDTAPPFFRRLFNRNDDSTKNQKTQPPGKEH